jgi:hypothetical protein
MFPQNHIRMKASSKEEFGRGAMRRDEQWNPNLWMQKTAMMGLSFSWTQGISMSRWMTTLNG